MVPETPRKNADTRMDDGNRSDLGEMVNEVKRSDYTVGLMDTMIAATAKRHDLIVATRNVDDFKRCGVEVLNPFDGEAAS